MRSRLILLATIIAAGILSRAIHTSWILFDKYLGDVLYAAMVYLLISLVWHRSAIKTGVLAMAVMTAIELFQLTKIPAQLLANGNAAERLAARLMGTQFSYLDLLSYAAGITIIACWHWKCDTGS